MWFRRYPGRQTDRHTHRRQTRHKDRQTQRHAHHNTSPPLPRKKYSMYIYSPEEGTEYKVINLVGNFTPHLGSCIAVQRKSLDDMNQQILQLGNLWRLTTHAHCRATFAQTSLFALEAEHLLCNNSNDTCRYAARRTNVISYNDNSSLNKSTPQNH